jgi:hypothetical protein
MEPRMKRWAAPLLAFSLGIGPAAATDSPSPFSLSGFGTLSAVRTDKDNRAFRSSTLQDSGAGTALDLSVDTVLGLQGSFKFSQTLDITVQTVARKGRGDSYDPQVTWSFLRFLAAPALSIRVGRTRTPFFMYSDSLNLNYASPWVRPPVEVYSLNPFSNLDGIDALYRQPVGDLDLELHAYAGKSDLKLNEVSGKLRAVRGIRGTLSTSGLTAQVGFAKSNLALNWGGSLFSSLSNQLEASGNTQALNEISGSDGKTTFISSGFQYDQGKLLVVGEYAMRTVDRYTSSSVGWYLTSGYHFGALTPYVTYARQREVATDISATTGIPRLDSTIDLFNGLRNKAQRSVAVGIRWDAARNVALKAQLERVQPGPHGLGIFLSDDYRDNLNPGGPVHVLTLSTDFVF